MFSISKSCLQKGAFLCLFLCLLFYPVFGEEKLQPSFVWELSPSFYIPYLEDPTYGAWGYTTKISREVSSRGVSLFSVGIRQSFHFAPLDGSTFYGGDEGFSSDFGLYAEAGKAFYPFQGRNFFLGGDVFLGWKVLYIDGVIHGDYLEGEVSYTSREPLFNWGILLKTGWKINDLMEIQQFLRIPLKGLTDGDLDSLFNGDIAEADTKIYFGLGVRIGLDR